jgi:hypothetical protein
VPVSAKIDLQENVRVKRFIRTAVVAWDKQAGELTCPATAYSPAMTQPIMDYLCLALSLQQALLPHPLGDIIVTIGRLSALLVNIPIAVLLAMPVTDNNVIKDALFMLIIQKTREVAIALSPLLSLAHNLGNVRLAILVRMVFARHQKTTVTVAPAQTYGTKHNKDVLIKKVLLILLLNLLNVTQIPKLASRAPAAITQSLTFPLPLPNPVNR